MRQLQHAHRLAAAIVVAFAAMLLVYASPCSAEITLHGLFSDLMVLPRDVPLPVRGTANTGETVRVDIAGQSLSAVADADGRWRAILNPLTLSSQGYELRVAGSTSSPLVLKNVVVGDVWLCAGASSMAFPVMKTVDAHATMEAAQFPNIRFLSVWGGPEEKPLADCGGVWTQCNPGTVEAFSAIGYAFGRKLHEALHIPIGLIRNPWDGTRAIAWAPRTALEAEPALQTLFKKQAGAPAQFTTQLEARHKPSALYNGLTAPLTDFPIRGVIWSQGEADAAQPALYEPSIQSLVTGYRAAWKQPQLPIGMVDAAFDVEQQDASSRPPASQLYDAQRKLCRLLPNVGLISIEKHTDATRQTDYGDMGRRLADWAISNVYSGRTAPINRELPP